MQFPNRLYMMHNGGNVPIHQKTHCWHSCFDTSLNVCFYLSSICFSSSETLGIFHNFEIMLRLTEHKRIGILQMPMHNYRGWIDLRLF